MHEILLPSSKRARFLNSYRHPDQAAIVARLPLLGRRVPNRAYWEHQPIKPSRIRKRLGIDITGWMRDAAGTAGLGASMGARTMAERRRRRRGARGHGRNTEQRDMHPHMHSHQVPHGKMTRMGMRDRWMHRPRLGIPMLFVGASVGALLMYVFDPYQGRRRRALIRDKVAHMKNVMTRDVPTRVEKRGRFFRGVAKGVVHETADALSFNGHPIVDNDTLVARVRSEVLRDARIHAGEIHVDAYEGCVTLRGQLDHQEDIRRLIGDTSRVEGVREVRNFLHLPGTPPPNKAEVYRRREQVPAQYRQ